MTAAGDTTPIATPHTCRLGEHCAYRDLPEVDAAHRHRRALLCLFLLIAAFSAGLTTAVALLLEAVR